ncbi:MAG: hypothetical protein A2312_00370 [Candidatus Staskawiczbacteria bacterium RIFOXYB2_FULL_32_9]|uniref:Serine protease n=1 Tax=Candidatus Staskawiczbacteria bacterium RIFOXYD1_FULL_32_13 TaxID=1802234 RepID=A0A1G2JKQ9_9BACT|nr:MAG: hypothetical protein UR22_C0001G0059 [Parcubacteria group bacterium GW2011_GWC2_32_10]OGZ77561.1 MAG: hypothetical protein A2256_02260 [Candidatus Staskawiczbacteria bacterium RIFOXYA2_FULL_32_7]OGZ78263.1 MAG: hypothetical protein A2360_03790 [Candidatus Staskawiczbacteria bacterium RIFOXYB1_FULL_32_11]OGZ84548.1 MAG: hypothetical protein A2312_00370 [Candidatus Staskawiczbacteria bacterium RIFOXYB2_FULL_32_9]OGZ87694.1 MAG: hypothetical protein A2561_03310 [Candidatus Staskawiczbacter
MFIKNVKIIKITGMIVLGVFVIFIFIIGFIQYKNYIYNEDIVKKQSQSFVEDQNRKLEEAKKEFEAFKIESQQKMDEVKNQIKNNPINKEIIVKDVQKAGTEESLSTIVSQWRPIIAYISCKWIYSSTGETLATSTGSGVLVQLSGSIYVITNRHVLESSFDALRNGEKYGADFCDITLPNGNYAFKVYQSSFKGSSTNDLGGLKIEYPTDYIKNLSAVDFLRCKNKALIGDAVAIIGYPGIGSKVDITVTKGIISGYEGDYYITDAKVEHGNSGGVAILLKDNCYLGIPTYAISGEVETLARILDQSIVFK